MQKVLIKRIDHLGIVAGTIRDLGIIKLIDELLGIDKNETITSGEAIAGMIINGLGFVDSPLMLTPQFFEHKALNLLIGPNVTPDDFNRHKLGRVLDKASAYGTEKLFGQVASAVCQVAGVDTKIVHADTTTFSLDGAYDQESDTTSLHVTHGHSKDMRPDLKQVVQEVVVSQDGGIPLMAKTWSGNASDTIILRERAKMITDGLIDSKIQCLIADAKLYAQKTAAFLNKIKFITRVPSTLKLESETIICALAQNAAWVISTDNKYKLQEFTSDNFAINNQRWIVVYSTHARDRAVKTMAKIVNKALGLIEKELFHLRVTSFSCEDDAAKSLATIAKKFPYHTITRSALKTKIKYLQRGRPSIDAKQELEYQIEALVSQNDAAIQQEINQRSCFVLATNASPEKVDMHVVLFHYKQQDTVEKSFAFLKSPEFFASSLYLKKPERIDGLLMVMVLALLVYSLAQRKLRAILKEKNLFIPNQIKQPTQRPTLRWIMQCFEGINYVEITINNAKTIVIDGISDLRCRIIELFGGAVQEIYQNSAA